MRDIDAILARDSKNEAEREEIYDLIDDCVKEIADKYGGVGDWKDSLGHFCEESFGEFIRKD